MRWKNKGHEYDEVYHRLSMKKGFYLFGCGDYGKQFLKSFQDEVDIIGYIDNNPAKQAVLINGKTCIGLDKVTLNKDEGIILTISQYDRAGAIEQLQQYGYRKDEDYFLIEEFISVYYLYRYDRVYFLNISFLPSTACNLKCRHCLNFNPFAKEFYVRDWDALKADIDLFFANVDYIMIFHVSGGEPMLYKYTADLITYIDEKYGDRIGTLRTVTNGTIVPSDDMLTKLSHCRVEVTVDDYRDAVPQYNEQFDELIRKLEQYRIKYYINKVKSWVDLAPEKTDYSAMSEEQLIRHRSECGQTWQELRDGKLYSCNYAAYATVAGIAGEQDLEESYDLRTHTEDKKKELVEFRLGYTNKGYTNFCRTCRGFTAHDTDAVEPAVQVKG
ncbi:MAG: radical SAM protein [Roseburia sp.]|nr:radical SAM protein [Roseburia sp.]